MDLKKSNGSQFAVSGKLRDERIESILHHYAVMLHDDFSNEGKVVDIENRLRDFLRNYDSSLTWRKRPSSVPPDRRWALYGDMEEASKPNYPRKALKDKGQAAIRYEDDGSITVVKENDPRESNEKIAD